MDPNSFFALLALVVSGYTLFLHMRDRRQQLNIHTKMDTKSSYRNNAVGVGQTQDHQIVSIHLSNPGEKPVFIESLCFKPQNGKALPLKSFQGIPTLPESYNVTVEPLRGVYFFADANTLAASLKESGYSHFVPGRFLVIDETRREYRGDNITLSLETLEKTYPLLDV